MLLKSLCRFFKPREPAFFLSFYVCLSSFGFLSSRGFYFSSSLNGRVSCFCYFCFCSFNLLFFGCLCIFYLIICSSFYSFSLPYIYFCFCSFYLLFCGCLCSFYFSSCFSFYCFNFRFSYLFCICSSGLSSFNFCLHMRNRFCSNSLNCSGCSSRCYLSFSCHCRCRSCYDCSRKHCFKHVHINPLRK